MKLLGFVTVLKDGVIVRGKYSVLMNIQQTEF